MRKRYLEEHIRVGDEAEAAGGIRLRKQVRKAIIDTPGEGYKYLKREINCMNQIMISSRPVKRKTKEKYEAARNEIYRLLSGLRDFDLKKKNHFYYQNLSKGQLIDLK